MLSAKFAKINDFKRGQSTVVSSNVSKTPGARIMCVVESVKYPPKPSGTENKSKTGPDVTLVNAFSTKPGAVMFSPNTGEHGKLLGDGTIELVHWIKTKMTQDQITADKAANPGKMRKQYTSKQARERYCLPAGSQFHVNFFNRKCATRNGLQEGPELQPGDIVWAYGVSFKTDVHLDGKTYSGIDCSHVSYDAKATTPESKLFVHDIQRPNFEWLPLQGQNANLSTSTALVPFEHSIEEDGEDDENVNIDDNHLRKELIEILSPEEKKCITGTTYGHTWETPEYEMARSLNAGTAFNKYEKVKFPPAINWSKEKDGIKRVNLTFFQEVTHVVGGEPVSKAVIQTRCPKLLWRQFGIAREDWALSLLPFLVPKTEFSWAAWTDLVSTSMHTDNCTQDGRPTVVVSIAKSITPFLLRGILDSGLEVTPAYASTYLKKQYDTDEMSTVNGDLTCQADNYLNSASFPSLINLLECAINFKTFADSGDYVYFTVIAVNRSEGTSRTLRQMTPEQRSIALSENGEEYIPGAAEVIFAIHKKAIAEDDARIAKKLETEKRLLEEEEDIAALKEAESTHLLEFDPNSIISETPEIEASSSNSEYVSEIQLDSVATTSSSLEETTPTKTIRKKRAPPATPEMENRHRATGVETKSEVPARKKLSFGADASDAESGNESESGSGKSKRVRKR